ncbi:latent-transforming growth factor beta-binding protein 4-like isoform X2 [Sycon ciliatum]|uniref:latent-transforming growth factor beta-binding protein 4-like isoform X2 n=1 Tax=Sycon ciliatum TaxID=27933 RepID=UPI0031F649D5
MASHGWLASVVIVALFYRNTECQTLVIQPPGQVIPDLSTARATCVGDPAITAPVTWIIGSGLPNSGPSPDQISFDGPFNNTLILSTLDYSRTAGIPIQCSALVGGAVQFANDFIAVDLNECLNPNSCTSLGHQENSTTCVNEIPSFICPCRVGFRPSPLCSNIDECAEGTHNCSSSATCQDTQGSYQCLCPASLTYNGTDCIQTDPCVLSALDCTPRQAVCMPSATGTAECRCQTGYEFDASDVCADIDECVATVAHGCPDDSTCENLPGSFRCACLAGFEVRDEVCRDIDECARNGSSLCRLHSTCNNTVGSFVCECDRGFQRNGTECQNIDVCALGEHDCFRHEGTRCIDTLSGFLCVCENGYGRQNATHCADFDECAAATDGGASVCNLTTSTCYNTEGSFECPCRGGYIASATVAADAGCFDVDECLTGVDNCSASARCVNQVGTFACFCNSGFTGDGVECQDINECDAGSHNCTGSNMQCENIVGGFSCRCADGYRAANGVCEASSCSTDNVLCDPISACQDIPGGFVCVCPPGFTGTGRIGDCTAIPTSQPTTETTETITTSADSMATTTAAPTTTMAATTPVETTTTPASTIMATTPAPTEPLTVTSEPPTTSSPAAATPQATTSMATATIASTQPVTTMPAASPTVTGEQTSLPPAPLPSSAPATTPVLGDGATTGPAAVISSEESAITSSASTPSQEAPVAGGSSGGLSGEETGIIIGVVVAALLLVVLLVLVILVRKRREQRKTAIQQADMTMFNPMYGVTGPTEDADRYTNVTAFQDNENGTAAPDAKKGDDLFRPTPLPRNAAPSSSLNTSAVTTFQSTEVLVDI